MPEAHDVVKLINIASPPMLVLRVFHYDGKEEMNAACAWFDSRGHYVTHTFPLELLRLVN
jgi:hypothetical protein